MHPIERLRYLARSQVDSERELVAESVDALRGFTEDPKAMLVSFRQLIVRHPQSPALLALASRMLVDLDPMLAGHEFLTELDVDRSDALADEMFRAAAGGPQSEPAEIVDSIASSRNELLLGPGRTEWITEARSDGREVIVVTAAGTRLPTRTWQGFLARNHRVFDPPAACELVPIGEVDRLIGPGGLQRGSGWSPDCYDVAEIVSF